MSRRSAPEIRAVLTDVDGTLVIPGHDDVTERVRDSVRRVREQGTRVIPVTSRSYPLMEDVIDLLALTDLCVLDGGATIAQTTTGERVWSQWLQPETLQNVVGDIGKVCTKICYEALPHARTSQEIDIAGITEAAPSVFAVFPAEHRLRIAQSLAEVAGIACHFNIYDGDPLRGCVQVTDQAVDKEYTVHRLLELAALEDKDVLAIGDGNNDIPFFRAIPNGTKVAMGNASDALKGVADYIVPSVEADGFAVAMGRHVLETLS